MVFPSIPTYFDPANWHQQPQNQTGGINNQFPLPLPQPAPLQPHGSGGGAGSIRPGSMADRARMANIPMSETALKCPRCESGNTKFCYFNNYSLTQPRHFCKTCRRYWTRGGALRSVPVGGGCRRNKRTKATTSNNNCSSKSSVSGDMSTGSASTCGNDMVLGYGGNFPLQQLRFMGIGPNNEYPSGTDSYGGIAGGATDMAGFHFGNALAAAGHVNGGGLLMSSIGSGFNDQWRFPGLLGGRSDSPSSSGGMLHPFDQSHGYEVGSNEIRPKISRFLSGLQQNNDNHTDSISNTHLPRQMVKTEDNNQRNEGGVNLARQLNDHFWNNTISTATTNTFAATNPWTDMSSFTSSSSTSNLF